MFNDIHLALQQNVSERKPFAWLTCHHFMKAKGLAGNHLDQAALHL
jgi:hypothetical protein